MKRLYTKHRFDRSILTDIKKLYVLDNWHAVLAISIDYAVIAASILSVHIVGWAAYPIAVMMIGARQRALSTMVHDAAHGTLASNKALAWVLSTFFSGFPVFSTPGAYKESHISFHHGRFGDPEKDPDYKFMLDRGAYKIYDRESYVREILVKPLLLGHVSSYMIYLLRARALSFLNKSNRLEAILFFAYWAVVIGFGLALGQVSNILLFWIIPFLTSFQIIGWFIELSEHAPLMLNNVDLYMSRNRHSHWLEHLSTGIHGENYHLAHHLQPRVPFWRMKQLHQLLLRDADYRNWDERCGGIFFSNNGAPSVISTLATRSFRRVAGNEISD